MKMQIRSGVFETNSSSTHVIAISKNNVSTDYPDYIHFGLFDETDYCTYARTMQDKADFLYTQILYLDDIELIEEYKKKITEYLNSIGIYNIEFEHYYTREDEEENLISDTYDMDMCIDGESLSADFVNEILSDKEMFLNYLFGKDSCILLGRDCSNYKELSKLRDKGCKIMKLFLEF